METRAPIGVKQPADSALARLVAALRDPGRYPHPADRVEVLETHISYVLLAGEYAYKLKKPLDLGFLDFRTLDSRRHFCEEELRLNRRLAPDLYLAVVAITGTPDDPALDGKAPAIEYAVKMRRFSQDALLDRVLGRRELTAAHIDSLAARIAAFHQGAGRIGRHDLFDYRERILAPAIQNFDQIRPLLEDDRDIGTLEALRAWIGREFKACENLFGARSRAGFVRECHGDLHLGNMALAGDGVVIFDCIEFNDAFRWIDVMNEAAFLFMDLVHRGRPDFAYRFLNAYLEATGDYQGMGTFRFYLVYRAMVRAKVTLIREHQPGLGGSEKQKLLDEYRNHVRLAREFSAPGKAAVIINHGFSGSGKTTLSREAAEIIGAIRIRSDVERKRLHGLDALSSTGSGVGAGLYTADVTRSVYERLADLARGIVHAGYPVMVDATFLERGRRDAFKQLAKTWGVPFAILDFSAEENVLRARVLQRQSQAQDASEAGVEVLEHQLAAQEPLGRDELSRVISVDAGRPPGDAALGRAWRILAERIRPK